MGGLGGAKPPPFTRLLLQQFKMIVIDSRTARAERLRRALQAWAVEAGSFPPGSGALLITLTFAQGDRDRAKGQIVRFVQALRDRGIRCYFWFAELQKRGVIHYHLIIVGRRFLSHKWLSEIWGLGWVWVEYVGLQNAFRYVLKYARKLGKGYQVDYQAFSKLYRGFRIFSHNRLQDWFARSWKLPAWLRELVWERGEIPRRLAGAGWVFLSSGELVRSPWRLLGVEALEGGGWLLLMLKDSSTF